jgi:hypothetical protein
MERILGKEGRKQIGRTFSVFVINSERRNTTIGAINTEWQE